MKIVFYASEIGGGNITNQCAVGESKRCELFLAFSLQLNPYSSHNRMKDNTSHFAPWPVCRLRVNYSAERMEALSESLSKAWYLSLARDKFRLSPMDPVCWILIKICVVWPTTTRRHPITVDPHCREETRLQSVAYTLDFTHLRVLAFSPRYNWARFNINTRFWPCSHNSLIQLFEK